MTLIAFRFIETLCFGIALFMIIPPVPSEIGQAYTGGRAITIGGLSFVSYLGIKIWRKEEVLLVAISKSIIYVLVAMLVYKRVFG